MFFQKKAIANLLFGVQIVCTVIFGGSQFFQMITTSQGVSISWFVCWQAFLMLNLVLAIRAHQNHPSQVTLQTIFSYALWVTMVTLDLGAIFWKDTAVWNNRDTITVSLTAIGIMATIVTAKRNHLSITDPLVKGYLAIFFKAVPQLILAYNIFLMGGNGLTGVAIIAGHTTILTRLGQLWFSIKEADWDRNRIGSAISEIANEGSWVIVTIIWLIR